MYRCHRFIRSRPGLFRLAAALGMFVFAMPPGQAATWPSPGCNSTLQACIDAAPAGDTITIGYNGTTPYVTAIDENIVIDKSLTLKASLDIDAVFTDGHSIIVQSPSSGAVNVTLQRLTLIRGHLRVNHYSDTASTYALSQLTFKETDAGIGSCAIDFVDQGSGSPFFQLGDSRLETRIAGSANGFCATGEGGPWNVNFFRNQVRTENGSLLRAIVVGGTSSGNITLEGNQVSGSGFSSGIAVSQNAGSSSNTLSMQSNAVVGQHVSATDEWAIRVFVTNTNLHVVNNSVVNNARGIRVARFAADSSSGRVANNLVAFNESVGIDLAGFVSNDYNLVYANGSNSYTPGVHDVLDNPLLASSRNPRLSALSPARDAGNSADVSGFLGIAFDADGEQRVTQLAVDIGAYEFNQDLAAVQMSSALNTAGNVTYIDALPGLVYSEALLVTPQDSGTEPGETSANLGVYYTGALSPWAIFREAGGALSTGRSYSVLAPYDGRARHIYTSVLADVVNAFTRLDYSELNGTPTAIAFIEHNWNPGGVGGTYHDHPLALSYASSHWYIGNQDSVDMPVGVSFNVVVAPVGSPNAFTVPVPASGYCCLTLYHPLLDNNACAAPQVTRNNLASGVTDSTPFAVHYSRGHGAGAPGHWEVRTTVPLASFVAGTAFNVMVQGAQANACRDDIIFADGLEN